MQYPDKPDLSIGDRGILVTVPTIAKMRDVLSILSGQGVADDTPITISHLANAHGTFFIRTLAEQS